MIFLYHHARSPPHTFPHSHVAICHSLRLSPLLTSFSYAFIFNRRHMSKPLHPFFCDTFTDPLACLFCIPFTLHLPQRPPFFTLRYYCCCHPHRTHTFSLASQISLYCTTLTTFTAPSYNCYTEESIFQIQLAFVEMCYLILIKSSHTHCTLSQCDVNNGWLDGVLSKSRFVTCIPETGNISVPFYTLAVTSTYKLQ